MSTKPNQQTTPIPAETIIPTHLGLILDGNRRWAKERGLAPMKGHREGYETLKKIGDAALARGIKYLSAFVFSTENWQRPADEVKYLMDLLLWVATSEVEEMHRKNVRLRFIGRPNGLSSKILKAIEAAEAKTAKNTRGTLALCLNYGGHYEIADAAAKMIAEGVKADEVTPEKFAQYLYAPDIPPVDYLIRTSGEHRTSGYMLYRSDYAELKFIDKHWPDFTEADLDAALAAYASRQRRFGQ